MSYEDLLEIRELLGKKNVAEVYFIARSEKVPFARLMKMVRDEEIKKYFEHNVSSSVIAQRFRLSIRQVERLYLKYLFGITKNPRYKTLRHK
jgi:transcriptional regulator GlxA family with amidase domain